LENNEVITLSMAERSFSSSPNDLRLFLDSILHQASAHRFQEFAKLSALLTSRSSTQRQSLSCVRVSSGIPPYTLALQIGISGGARHRRKQLVPVDLFILSLWACRAGCPCCGDDAAEPENRTTRNSEMTPCFIACT
jgi:hypothetical protein